jgi:dTMP kinase
MNDGLFASTATAPGLFVTVDGPNGSGKSTLIDAIVGLLGEEPAIYRTRQPSPTTLGELIRGGEQNYRGRALACLVAGDRHYQLSNEVLPRLQAGAIVLCDRYVESSLVLQRLDGVPTEEILTLNRGILRPDLRIRLFADADILAARLAARPVDPSRRFEQIPGASGRELLLYEDADRLLSQEHEAPATAYDTSYTEAEGLAARVSKTIQAHRNKRHE